MISKFSGTVAARLSSALAGRVRNVCHTIIDRALAPVFAWADAQWGEGL